MRTLKSVMVGHSRRIAIDDFNEYLKSIGTEPYPNDGTSGFLKVRECAEWLNVSIGYIYKMIYEFENEPVQIGMADISENENSELKLYDVDEVAEILHLKRTTVFNMIAAGEIDSFKMRNKKRMFTQEAVDTYISKQIGG